MRRIFITGAGGFVGRYVLDALSAAPTPSQVTAPSVSGRTGQTLDIADAGAVDKAIETHKPDAVIHLAAVALPREAQSAPEQAWAVNFQGTLNIARSLRRHCSNARMVFAGSSEAYGAAFTRIRGAINEDAPLMPQTVYSATKACADIALGQMAADGLDCVRFRPFNHTGPGQAPHYVVADFARQVAEIEAGFKPPVIRVGNLDAERDFLDVRDVARAYVLAATGDLNPAPDTAFNLASGQSYRIGSILEALLDQASVPIAVEKDPARMRPSDIPRTLGNAGRARDIFGWEPQIDMQKTISDVLADQRFLIGTMADETGGR